jgi:hypothetical protein
VGHALLNLLMAQKAAPKGSRKEELVAAANPKKMNEGLDGANAKETDEGSDGEAEGKGGGREPALVAAEEACVSVFQKPLAQVRNMLVLGSLLDGPSAQVRVPVGVCSFAALLRHWCVYLVVHDAAQAA